MNSRTEGELEVDDVKDIVAVIIDPGPPLDGQSRPSTDPIDYLEGGNQINDGKFVTSSSDPFNDRVVYITHSELMPLVERRVLGFVRDWLRDYYLSQPDPKYFPTPAPLDSLDNQCTDSSTEFGLLPLGPPTGSCLGDAELILPTSPSPHWFDYNDWYRHIFYHTSCKRGSSCSADISLNGEPPDVAILATFGRRIETQFAVPGSGFDMQDRSGSGASDIRQYLDSEQSTDSDNNEYQVFRVDSRNNDVALTIGRPVP